MIARNYRPGPAPKEEEMDVPAYNEKHGVNFYHIFNNAYDTSFDEHEEHQDAVEEGLLAVLSTINPQPKARTAERRALAREAYMAALGGVCADPNIEKEAIAVHFAQGVAIETIKQWDAFLAAVDAEGGE
jgi:hypothetical protein